MNTPAAPTGFSQARTIAPDHPAFAGHFPGQPILPGVCLLAEVQAVWAAAAASAVLPPVPQPLTLANAKFLSPVGPGDVLVVTLSAEPRQLRFAVARPDGQAVAAGAFSLAGVAA